MAADVIHLPEPVDPRAARARLLLAAIHGHITLDEFTEQARQLAPEQDPP